MSATAPSPRRMPARGMYALGALAALLFGYDNGIIAAAILFIPDDIALTALSEGLVVSATVIGAMVGALGGGPAADRRGRHRALLAAAVVFTVGAAGAALATTVVGLVLFRLVLGVGIGIASVVVPLYLAEIAPARDRGVVTSLNQYMIIVGTALAAGAGYLLASASAWRWMVGIGVIPAVVLLAGSLVMPDTPRSLVRRGHPEQARAVLRRLRVDHEAADRELEEIRALETERTEPAARGRFRLPWVRRLLLLGAVLAVFQQITGINAIVYYAPSVLTDFGLSERSALLFTFLNGLLNIATIAVVVRAKLVDRRGRRPVLLTGVVGMSASLAAVGVAALVLPSESAALLAVSVIAFVVFTNTFSATWGPVLWVVLAEIFPLAVRGAAMAVATLFNWLTNVFVSLTFPTFTELAGAGAVFLAYALAGAIVFPLVHRLLPETRERSLESLESTFRAGARAAPSGPSGPEER